MRRLAIAAIIALAAGTVLAQSPPEGTPTRITGTVDKLEGQTLTVARPDGQKQSVTLTPDAKIFGVEKRKLTDIKPGDFLASGGVPERMGRSMRLRCGFFLRHYAASVRANGPGMQGRKV